MTIDQNRFVSVTIHKASNSTFDAIDRLTDEPIELIWSPARFFDIKQKAISLEAGDKFFSKYEVEYDSIGL